MPTRAHPQSIVMKFGGTSLGSIERIRGAAQLVADRKKQHPVVITSAMSGVTNLLIATAQAAIERDEKTVGKNLEALREKHLCIADQPETHEELETLFRKLAYLYEGVMMLRELSPRTLDVISSFGERLSSWLMVETLESMGTQAERFDSRELIETDECFGGAEVNWKSTRQKITRRLLPTLKKGVVPVVTGYIGATKEGQTTTLGRGGSDYSAAILGVNLKSDEIQIWTDVDGMMTSDPRVVKNVKALPQISFQEAAEMAFFGAKVLHPKTIQPAVDANIPVKILNTMNPRARGTTILNETAPAASRDHSIKAIAFRKNTSIINICSSRMLGPYGFMARIFNLFDLHKVSVDVIATTEVSVSVTVEDGSFSKELIRDLETFASVKIIPHQTVISVVGNGLKDDYRVEAKIFKALAEAKISSELISKGASQINLTFLVATAHAERAVQKLHDALF